MVSGARWPCPPIARVGSDGRTAHHRVRGRDCSRRGIGFAEKVHYMLPRKGPEHDARAKLDPLCAEGIVLGYCRDSPEYQVYDIKEGKMVLARTIRRVPEDERWDAKVLEGIQLRAKCMFEPKPARGVHVEGFEMSDEKPEVKGKSKTQRVAIYEKDHADYGITDDCKKCLSNQKNGYNKNAKGLPSTMPHTERCRKRMEEALATTEDGRRRLERAKERVDAWIAKEIEAADARPEGEKKQTEEAVPSIAVPFQNHPDPAERDLLDDLLGGDRLERFRQNVTREKRREARSEGERLREDFEDGFIETELDGNATPVAHSPGGDDDGDAQMENRNDDLYEPSDLDEEMTALLNVCAGRPRARRRMEKDAQEVLNIVRELGGSQKRYRRERGKMLRAVVSEVYSPPRVTKVLKMLPTADVLPGFALDLTTVNERGEHLDFTQAAKRKEALEKIETEKPYIVIGSPICTPWSSLQNLSEPRRDPAAVERERVEAEVHLRFVCDTYKAQYEAGRYFLHGHPLFATSWKTDIIQEVMELPGVETAWGDQCQNGQQGGTDGPVNKPTRWLSNSDEVLRMLDHKCSDRRGNCSRPQGGKHQACEGQTARRAAEYPLALCKAIIQGVRNQLREDGRLRPGHIGILPREENEAPLQRLARRVEAIYNVALEDDTKEKFGLDDGPTSYPRAGQGGAPQGAGLLQEDGRVGEEEEERNARADGNGSNQCQVDRHK